MRSNARSARIASKRANIVNVLALVVAIPAFGYALFVDTPRSYVVDIGTMFASASASLTAQVPSNPYNSLAAQLSEKEALLNEREAQFDQREMLARSDSSLDGRLGIISFVISIVLFVLVGINFYLDMRRGRVAPARAAGFSVNLR